MRQNSNHITRHRDCADCDHQSSSFFCNMAREDLKALSINKSASIYKKGQVIFNEGNRPHGLYCIYEGKVKLSKLGDFGKEQILRMAKNGDILGYRAAVCNEKYYSTATALEDSEICHISLENFNKVLCNSTDLNFKLMKLLTTDVKESEKKILNISQKNVEERVAEALMVLYEVFGMEEDGQTINVTITRKEIGDMAGVTTESTIRKLSDFSRKGLIKIDGRKLLIPDVKKLSLVAKL
ncbi:MAG TPA: Crp/Fnr family transcriptional regulator [Flavobacteriales bacterium]|nr:Crp/Fnr family transcriptional regulator [Flavobacteriales bacterium]